MFGRGARVVEKGGTYLVVDPMGVSRPATVLEVDLWRKLHELPPAPREVFIRVSETDLRAIMAEVHELRVEKQVIELENADLRSRLSQLLPGQGDDGSTPSLPPDPGDGSSDRG